MPFTASDTVDLSVSTFSAFIYRKLSLAFDYIAKVTPNYHEIGHHISDERQPERLIDRGSSADIVTYSHVSGKEEA